MAKKKAKKSAKTRKAKTSKRIRIAIGPIRKGLNAGIAQLETAIADAKGRGGSKSAIRRAEKRLKGMRAAVRQIGKCTDLIMSSISFDF